MISTLKISCSNFGIPPNTCSSAEPIKNMPTSYKIEFDSFTLSENGVSCLPISQNEYDIILKAFPTAQLVGVYLLFVVLQFKCLPPKPWPQTIAGLPAFFTTKEHSVGFEYGRLGGSFKKAWDNHDARQHLTRDLFDAVIVFLSKRSLSQYYRSLTWHCWNIS